MHALVNIPILLHIMLLYHVVEFTEDNATTVVPSLWLHFDPAMEQFKSYWPNCSTDQLYRLTRAGGEPDTNK